MDTKICTGPCGLEKELTKEFFSFRPERGTWQTQCRKCVSAKQREGYHAVPGRKERTNQASLERYRKNSTISAEYTNNYKADHGCSQCEESDPICLDFHHVEEKVRSISELIWGSFDLETVKEEMKRCVVLCSNCHRKLHGRENI